MTDDVTADSAGNTIDQRCAALAAQNDFSRDDIHELCGYMLDSNERARKLGTRTLFASIVERLSDAFEPGDTEKYDRIFAQVLDACRRHPDGGFLDAALRRFGLRTEADLLERKRRLASPNWRADGRACKDVKRILVLSRVTLGADVSVTSVIVNALASSFPGASFALVGQPPIGDLYDASGSLQILDAVYARHGSLLDRLRSWTDLVALVDRERDGLNTGELLVVDPDSRLPQLGLLPVVEDEREYLFFDSRSFMRPGIERLSELAAVWGEKTFGGPPGARPFIHLAGDHLARGQRSVAPFRRRGLRVAAFNFGVGGNESKRLDFEFEVGLTLAALDAGCGLILDKGAGDEALRIDRIVGRLRSVGRNVVELDAAASPVDAPPDTEVVTWRGGPGAFGGLIAAADVYMGYDSAFQHVAAALGVRVIDLFVGQSNERFIARWTPHSRAPVHVVRLDAGTPPSEAVKVVLPLIR